MRQVLIIFLILGMIIMSISWASSEPRTLSDEVVDILAKGYKSLSQSKFDEAQAEYEKVIKEDFDNPYANNNLAVIMEKQGKLSDAMTYLNIGEKYASQYLNEIEKVYLFGNVCAAVNTKKTTSEKSQIIQVITENKKKLAEKIGVAPLGTPTRSDQ